MPRVLSVRRLATVARDTARAAAMAGDRSMMRPDPRLHDLAPVEHMTLGAAFLFEDWDDARWRREGEWVLDDTRGDRTQHATWAAALFVARQWPEDRQTADVVIRFRSDVDGGVNPFDSSTGVPAEDRLEAWERERRAVLAAERSRRPSGKQLKRERKAAGV